MQNDDSPIWVASVQSTQSGEYYRFPNLNALIQFLQSEFGEANLASEAVSEVGNETSPPEGRIMG
jgi:hypothetical protein